MLLLKAHKLMFLCFSVEKGSLIHIEPYKCCLIPNFISDEEFLKSLQKELLQLKFFEKSNDLYKFQQVRYTCTVYEPCFTLNSLSLNLQS